MKFYITGRSNNYERVKSAFEEAKKRGHDIDFEWTQLPMIKPYIDNQEKAAEYAQCGIKAAAEADVYIIFTHEDGNGVFAEFGAALAGYALRGAPKVYAIGASKKQYALFYFHPAISWVDSIEAVFADLEE